MTRFTLTARGPFSLAASTRFLEGFAPAGYTGAQEGVLDLAFAVEGSWQTVGVRVRQQENEVVGEAANAGDVDADAVARQVARILSLDVDGSGFSAVGESAICSGGIRACGRCSSGRRTRRRPGRSSGSASA